jgi:hypothetical protein
MPADMFCLALLLVEALGRIHVPAIFGDHVGHDAVEPRHLALLAQDQPFAIAARAFPRPRMKSFIV